MSDVKYALLSVSDKGGLVALGRALCAHGYTLLSTGGTARHLRDAGLPVTEVAALTGAPELLDGRVKTLHPTLHGGLLARRDDPAHVATMMAHGLPNIEVVVVNLYPFGEVVARGAALEEAVEHIDIGGPAMLRAAAKNFASITALVDPADYPALIDALPGGGVDLNARMALASKVYAHTSAYDARVVAHLSAQRATPGADEAPAAWGATGTLQQTLRYGENPHQRAALYTPAGGAPLGGLTQLQGKALSYNNLIDLDAALALLGELDGPGCAIIKHTNPAGCAQAATLEDAYEAALACDPVSAFGAIVALNRPLTPALAARLGEHFYEIIAAPQSAPEAIAALSHKPNLRLMQTPPALAQAASVARLTALGWLVQEEDPRIAGGDWARWEVISPEGALVLDDALRDSLLFAWRVAKHVKSNAIVLAQGQATLGVGAGQMSRVDAVRLAIERARAPVAGAVLASDAFFPFRDGVDAAAQAGVRAIIQPGGSRRDAEVRQACEDHGLLMILTHERHFRH